MLRMCTCTVQLLATGVWTSEENQAQIRLQDQTMRKDKLMTSALQGHTDVSDLRFLVSSRTSGICTSSPHHHTVQTPIMQQDMNVLLLDHSFHSVRRIVSIMLDGPPKRFPNGDAVGCSPACRAAYSVKCLLLTCWSCENPKLCC